MQISEKQTGVRMRELTKKLIFECVAIGAAIILFSVMQVSFFSVFGASPAIVLSLVCAAGFLCGERTGAVCGIIGGTLIDLLGSSAVIILPLVYMLAGYLCGRLIRIFLRRNFISFMIFSLVTGLGQSALTLGYISFYTEILDITKVFVKVLVPEYIAYLLCAPISYFLCMGLKKLTGYIIQKTKKYHLSKREDS